MRHAISISMLLSGIWTVLTGITQQHHELPAIIFTILFCIHIYLNRKPLLVYFKGLRWKWLPVGLGMIIILVTSI